jgi:hypothetical protein
LTAQETQGTVLRLVQMYNRFGWERNHGD